MMTKKDYIEMSDGISKNPDRRSRDVFCESIGAICAATNPKFDWDAWRRACNATLPISGWPGRSRKSLSIIKPKPLRTIQPRPEPTKHMSDVKLGTTIEGEQSRDAIHVAIAPCVAAHYLCPGDHVGILEDGKAGGSPNPIGIVDPFLKEGVQQGQKFWVLMYPGTIKGLRHEWEHPAFKVAEPAPEPEEDDDGCKGCS